MLISKFSNAATISFSNDVSVVFFESWDSFILLDIVVKSVNLVSSTLFAALTFVIREKLRPRKGNDALLADDNIRS